MKGFKDVLPESIEKWHYLENKARLLLEHFGYKEIRTPILEKTEVFQRSVGDATDIVEKEMYTFLDKANESVTLRPEGTAGVAMAFMENNLYTNVFNKFYYIGPMFRYERPQKGRLRQFHQIGAEVYGVTSPTIDAEIVYINKLLLDELKIESNVEINNIGCKKCRPNYTEALFEYFKPYKDQLCSDCQKRLFKNPLRILDCKNEKCKMIAKHAPVVGNFVCNECKNHYEGVKKYLQTLNIAYFENPYLVRGLDYYTSFVFEIKKDITLSAGGRYNDLIEELGGMPTCGVGFALGEERIIDLIKIDMRPKVDVYIANLGVIDYALKILKSLNKLTNIAVFLEYASTKSLKSMMKKADKLNTTISIIVGENEKINKSAIIRNMKQSTQETVSLETIEDYIKGVFYATK